MPRIRSLSTLVSLIVSSLVLSALVVLVITVSSSTYRNTLEEQSRAMENAAGSILGGMDRFLQDAEFMAGTLATVPSVGRTLKGLQDNRELTRLLGEILKLNDSYWSIVVFDIDGEVVAGVNAKGEDLTGTNCGDWDYCRAIMAGDPTYLGRSIHTTRSDRDVAIISVSASVRNAAKHVLGGVGIFPRWDAVTASFLDPVRIGDSGYGVILDASGTVIAHGLDKQEEGKDYSGVPFVAKALEQGEGQMVYDWNGETKHMVFRTQERTGWLVAMTAFEHDLASAANAQRLWLLVGGLLASALLIGAILYSLRRFVLGPLSRVGGYVEQIESGDYSAAPAPGCRYEIAGLSEGIQAMVAELKNRLGFAQGLLTNMALPVLVINTEGRVTYVNDSLTVLMEIDGQADDFYGSTPEEFFFPGKKWESVVARALREDRALHVDEVVIQTRKGTARTVQVDSAPLHDLDGKPLGAFSLIVDMTQILEQKAIIQEQNRRIARAAQEAQEIADRMASAAQELSVQVEQSSMGAEAQQERTSQAATAMGQMNAASMEAAKNATEAAQLAEDASKQAATEGDMVRQVAETIGSIRQRTEELERDMKELDDTAKGIGGIMETITDIADQTNLLALNAAIEAARAGTAGRGFAVVADEVRKLAEKTMEATGEVGRHVRSIQASVEKNIKGTSQTSEAVAEGAKLAESSRLALEGMVGLIDRNAAEVRAIASASEEQFAVSDEVSRISEDISRIALETAEAMRESSQAVGELAHMAARLQEAMNGLSQGH